VAPTVDGSTVHETTGAASVLLEPLLRGPDRPLAVLGRGGAVVHLGTGEPDLPLVSLTPAGAVRLPASMQVAGRLPVSVGTARAGLGRVLLDSLCVRVRRWWRPPAPVVRDLRRASARAAAAAPLLPPLEPAVAAALGPLRAAVRGGAARWGGTRAVAGLVGLGSGLTPSGDDVLAGAVVALRALERGGSPGPAGLASDLARATGCRATTALSAALLQDAGRGRCIPELAAFLEAVDRGGDLPPVVSRLVAVGHSSGAAMGHGAILVLTTAHVGRERS
jgi:Protein of unknown function (DUF2877)